MTAAGVALACAAAVAVLAAGAFAWRWARLSPRDRRLLTLRPWLARTIERRLGGYEQPRKGPDEVPERRAKGAAGDDDGRPVEVPAPRRVAVIGSGLAGLGAAAGLAERGVEVVMFEAEPHLGGKIAAFTVPGPEGLPLAIEHGFHAFFPHYYNLNRFLDRVGVRRHFRRIDDYLIVERGGRRHGFRELETTPGLNLLDLRRRGLYRLRDIVFGRARDEMGVFLEYDPERTPALLDGVSFRDFADRAELPDALRLVFSTFARAFFADEGHLSMAELVKSFHFYFLSHDHGLLYQYPAGEYGRTVLAPIERHLVRHGARIELGAPVDAIGYRPGEAQPYTVRGERVDDVVLATTSSGARAIAEASPELGRHAPKLVATLSALRPSQRYAVLRLWIDRDLRRDVPVFVATEREQLLDSVTLYHRTTSECAAWAARTGGAVLELHSYAVPDELADPAAVRRALLDELFHFFPELSGMEVLHEHLQLRADFTAYHVGMAASRPGTATELGGLWLAGDWVALPFPAMLMEGAYSSGLLAANGVLERAGARPHPITSVPPRGLLAGTWPARRRSQKAGLDAARRATADAPAAAGAGATQEVSRKRA